MSTPDQRYSAFISYPREHLESKWARRIQEKVEGFKTPPDLVEAGIPAKLGRVFVDDTELAASTSLTSAIRAALENSDWLLVICSPSAVERPWVNEEIRFFTEDLGRGSRIVPILVAGTPDSSFPEALKRAAVAASNQFGDLPLAIDFRQTARLAVRRAVVRVTAALLGCTFDQLWRRNEERRRKRARRLTVAVTGVALIVLATTMFGLLQRAKRQLADQLRITAEDKRSRADDAERLSRALAHFSRGSKAQADRELDAARLQYAAAASILDRPEFRTKFTEVYGAPSQAWQVQLPKPAGGDVFVRARVLLPQRGSEVWIATGNRTVEVLDAQTGEPMKSLRFAHTPVALAEEPLGNWVAVGFDDGSIILIDHLYRAIRSFHVDSPIAGLAIDSDGRYLAVGLSGLGIVVIDAATGFQKWSLPRGQETQTVEAIAFAPRGPRALFGMGRYLYYLSVADSNFGLFSQLDDVVLSIAYSRREELAAAAGLDGPIYVNGSLVPKGSGLAKEILSARKRPTPEFWNVGGHRRGTAALQFLGDGERLVSSGYDNSVRIWGTRTGEVLLSLTGHTAPVLSVAVSKDEDEIVAAGADGRIIAWKLTRSGKKIWSNVKLAEGNVFDAGTGNLAPIGLLSQSPGEVVIALRNQSIWRLKNGESEAVMIAPIRGSAHLRRPLFKVPDESAFARITRALPGKGNGFLIGMGEIELHLPNRVLQHWSIPGAWAAAPLSKDQWLVGTLGGTLEVRTWKKPGSVVWMRRNESVTDVASSRLGSAAVWKGGHLAVFGKDGKLKFETENNFTAEMLQFSQDGRFIALASAGPNATVYVLNASNGTQLFQRRFSTSAIEFSDNGRWMALGSMDTEDIALVSTSDWQTTFTLRYEGHKVVSLAFSPTNDVVFSGGEEGTVREWPFGEMLKALEAPPAELLASAQARSTLTLRGLDNETKTAAILSPSSSMLIAPPTASLADQIATAVNGAQSSKDSQQALRLEKLLLRCPNTADKTSSLQSPCATAEVARAKIALAEEQSSKAESALQLAWKRCESARLSQSAEARAKLLTLYPEIAESWLHLNQRDKALVAIQIGVDEHESLLLSNSSVAPPLQELTGLLNQLEDLIGKQPAQLEAFHSQTVRFLEKIRSRPSFKELADQGYGLYQFRLGQDQLELEEYQASATALAAAEKVYGEQVERLVQTGNPMADKARQRWAEVKAYRALALATPYLPRLTRTPSQTNKQQALQEALEVVNGAIDQFDSLQKAGRTSKVSLEFMPVLERLKEDITAELKAK